MDLTSLRGYLVPLDTPRVAVVTPNPDPLWGYQGVQGKVKVQVRAIPQKGCGSNPFGVHAKFALSTPLVCPPVPLLKLKLRQPITRKGSKLAYPNGYHGVPTLGLLKLQPTQPLDTL
jgi:hypothetical protein